MIDSWYPTYQEKVNNALSDYFERRFSKLSGPQEKEFEEALRYAVESGGKRLRPILAMLIYEEFMGLPGDAILPYVIGIELIHAYSLVHDDLPSIDNDEFRRGQLTVWRKYGEAMGILVGDALQAMGIECLAHGRNSDIIVEITRAIGDLGMIRGQVRDIFLTTTSMDQKEIIRLHDEKTGKLISAALVIGTLLAGKNDPMLIDNQRWFGMLLGRAFQVRDDILDYEGDPILLGKLTKKDTAKGKGIVAHMGIDKTKELLEELEIALLNIATTYQTTKFSDIVEYITKREK